MKSIKRIGLALGIIGLALTGVSCEKDDTLYYNNLTMGNIVEGKFISDQGNIFNVVEKECTGTIDSLSRVMILCDVLRKTEGYENEYDIRLRDYSSVLEKDAITLENADAEEETSVTDPVLVDQLWYSGGYLNLLVKNFVKTDSDKKHLINLVYHIDENGKYVFEVRHNAYGEVYGVDGTGSMTISGAYVSIPITKVIKEDSAKIIMKWKWYREEASGYNYSQTKEYSFEYDWKRSGFEQTPKTLSLRTSAKLL